MKHPVLLCISLFFLLTGCWDIEDADRMDYIHGVGVDYIDGEVVIHLQLVNLGALGTPEISGVAKNLVTIATGRGETVSSVIHDIYHSAQRELYWGHSTFVVLTEAALQHGKLQESIDILNRFAETRYRINVYATKDDVKEVLKVSSTFQGSPILTRITDLENTYDQSSLVEQVSARELIIQFDEPGHNGIIPTIEVLENEWETEDGIIPMIKDIGIAHVTPTNIQGFILHNDVRGVRWIQDSKRNDVTVYSDGKPASDVVVLNPSQTYTIEKEKDGPIFHLTVKAKGIIQEMSQGIGQKSIINGLEQIIKEEIIHTYNQGLVINADIYRLSEHLYRKELKTWQKLEENGQIPLDEHSLVVDVDIELIETQIDKTGPVIE